MSDTHILLIDNYDSFTYNLVHYLGELGAEVEVIRNDALSAEEVLAKQPDGIVLSPGPGTPDDSGVCCDVIRAADATLPILGVCLGHQSIGAVFGASIIRHTPMHGKTSPVVHQSSDVFKDLPSPFEATRYHSLIIDPTTVPDVLEVTANTEDGVIMGIAHRNLPIYGVQFHPESIASDYGHQLLDNFLGMVRQR